MKNWGKLQVYTGTGKGKTTAALGVALRAAGVGSKTLVLGFLKGDPSYGEMRAFHYLPGLTIKQVGRNEFVNFKDPEPIDLELAADGWAQAKACLQQQTYDLLILDELNITLAHKLLPEAEVLEVLKNRRGKTEVICTGRDAPQALIDLADLVTDMREVKHYYQQGLGIRDGIDH